MVARGVRVGASLDAIAAEVTKALRTGIVEARAGSLYAGQRQLVRELQAWGVDATTARLAAREAVRSVLRARVTATDYGKRWLALARDSSPAAASTATLARIKTIATTESAEAYNAGRLIALKAYSHIDVMRVWDSVLDKRTCRVCASADGEIVGVHERFKNGEPGAVHPNCRCTWQFVTINFTR